MSASGVDKRKVEKALAEHVRVGQLFGSSVFSSAACWFSLINSAQIT